MNRQKTQYLSERRRRHERNRVLSLYVVIFAAENGERRRFGVNCRDEVVLQPIMKVKDGWRLAYKNMDLPGVSLCKLDQH